MKDLQHWINPRDNVLPEVKPPVVEALPVDNTWKASFIPFNPQQTPVVYVMLEAYDFTDLSGYSRNTVRRNKYSEVEFSGTFEKDEKLWARVYVVDKNIAGKLDIRRWFGCPLNVIEPEQEIYNPESDILTRKVQKQLTTHDYAILALDKVENIFKNIDGILPRRNKHNKRSK